MAAEVRRAEREEKLYEPLDRAVAAGPLAGSLNVEEHPVDPQRVQEFVKGIISPHKQVTGAMMENLSERRGFHMDHAEAKRRERQLRKPKEEMTARELRAHGAFEIPDALQKYSVYVPLHVLWKKYITDLMSNARALSVQGFKLMKADFHGAIISVVRSRNPCLVGVSGILIQETTNALRLITPYDTLKVVPKRDNVFMLELPSGAVVTLYGNHLCQRSADRTARKFKAKPTIEL
eukprot:TRINITY_DN11915_c0_g1_i1.p1 TRINITY_DN11915_c0_g1~~TRINITY_DN11915_c0_g1_i1.p1  ORF type:complete len:270 (+),score=48.40 TRINITY_DN11915_c0_g1_i1:108-812(+)